MTKTDFSLYMAIMGLAIEICQLLCTKLSKINKKAYRLISMISIAIAIFVPVWFIKYYEFLPEDMNLTADEMLIKAEEYYKTEDYLKAIGIYNSDKLDTNAIALSNLGYFYEHGIGVNRDIQKAKENYQKAKQLGNEKALDNWISCILNYPESYDEILVCLKEGYDNNSQVAFEFIAKSMSAGQMDLSEKREVKENVKSFFEFPEEQQKRVFEDTQYENYVRQEDFSGIKSIFCRYKARVKTFKEIIGIVPYEFITDTGEKINTTEPIYLNRQITYLDIIEKRFYFANEYQTKYITCTK